MNLTDFFLQSLVECGVEIKGMLIMFGERPLLLKLIIEYTHNTVVTKENTLSGVRNLMQNYWLRKKDSLY